MVHINSRGDDWQVRENKGLLISCSRDRIFVSPIHEGHGESGEADLDMSLFVTHDHENEVPR